MQQIGVVLSFYWFMLTFGTKDPLAIVLWIPLGFVFGPRLRQWADRVYFGLE